MTLGTMLKLFSLPVAVAITALGYSGKLQAADQAVVAAPAVIGSALGTGTCATCNAAPATCTSCKGIGSLFHHRPCKPYQTTLCPGACFGYFQTQWHRWENVCPIPYQGVGLSDASLRPVPPAVAPAPPPKSVGSDFPVPKLVPMVPGK